MSNRNMVCVTCRKTARTRTIACGLVVEPPLCPAGHGPMTRDRKPPKNKKSRPKK